MAAEFIHRFIPGARQATRPVTLLALHPSDGDENDLIPVCRALAPGAAVLSPRLSPGICAADLAEWITGAATRYGIDASGIYALGYSGGANLAVATMLLYPGTIAGGVLLRPGVAIRPDKLPQLHGAPVLIAAGRLDPGIPIAESEALARLLSEAGAAVDLALSDSDHHLTPQDFATAKQWFAQLTTTGHAG